MVPGTINLVLHLHFHRGNAVFAVFAVLLFENTSMAAGVVRSLPASAEPLNARAVHQMEPVMDQILILYLEAAAALLVSLIELDDRYIDFVSAVTAAVPEYGAVSSDFARRIERSKSSKALSGDIRLRSSAWGLSEFPCACLTTVSFPYCCPLRSSFLGILSPPDVSNYGPEEGKPDCSHS